MSRSVIARFTSLGEAESARSALEAAGIDVVLGDENTVSMNWMYSQAIGGVKLLVHDEARAQALEILATRIEEAPPEDEEWAEAEASEVSETTSDAMESVLRCPACGSDDVRPIPRLKMFLFFSVVLYGAAYAMGEPDIGLAAVAAVAIATAFAPSHRCAVCGETSRQSAPKQPAVSALPDVKETIEPACPRCGSIEFYEINYRRIKAAALILVWVILVVLAVFPFLPKRRCQNCGFRK